MREAAKQTLDPHSLPAALPPAIDPLTMRLRWRLITRPARTISDAATLHVNQAARLAENTLTRRWRPMSAPSNPVPPWRWPGRARAERASQRAAVGERWRPLTAR